jgi:hypothetical protein
MTDQQTINIDNEPEALTESVFANINDALTIILNEEAVIKAASAKIAEQKAQLARYQDLLKDKDGKSVLPGVTFPMNSEVETNYEAVLSWALADRDRALAMASVLTISKEARFTVVQKAVSGDDALKQILALDTSAYNASVKDGNPFGRLPEQPPFEIVKKPGVSITMKNVKTGDALRAALPIVAAPVASVATVAP